MRLERVQILIKQQIAHLISQKKVADGRIGFVTITAVKINADLSQAKVYYSYYGPLKNRKKTQTGLQAAAGYIRSKLYPILHIKQVPVLKFMPDDSLSKGFDITEQLKDLH
eukprot:COSAG01_NODE_6_length_54687_cov_500.907599_11_plen_111_part_00